MLLLPPSRDGAGEEHAGAWLFMSLKKLLECAEKPSFPGSAVNGNIESELLELRKSKAILFLKALTGNISGTHHFTVCSLHNFFLEGRIYIPWCVSKVQRTALSSLFFPLPLAWTLGSNQVTRLVEQAPLPMSHLPGHRLGSPAAQHDS